MHMQAFLLEAVDIASVIAVHLRMSLVAIMPLQTPVRCCSLRQLYRYVADNRPLNSCLNMQAYAFYNIWHAGTPGTKSMGRQPAAKPGIRHLK